MQHHSDDIPISPCAAGNMAKFTGHARASALSTSSLQSALTSSLITANARLVIIPVLTMLEVKIAALGCTGGGAF